MEEQSTPIGLEDTFNDIASWFIPLAEKEGMRMGIGWQDTVSCAHDAFLHSYRTYDPEKSKFTTTLIRNLKFKLLDQRGRDAYYRRKHLYCDMERLPSANSVKRTWEELRQTLTGDVLVLADMAVNPPIPVMYEVEEKGGLLISYRMAIISALREAGWTRKRVMEAIADLKEALK